MNDISLQSAFEKYDFHPGVKLQSVLWPPAEGYPWAKFFKFQWTREAMLRRVAPGKLLCSWTTGGFCEPTDGNFTMLALSEDDGLTWKDAGRFEHPTRGLFTTELFVAGENEVHAFIQTYDSWRWFAHNQVFRSVSRDGGASWTTPQSVPGGVPPGWLNVGIRHSSGRWIIPLTWPELIGGEWSEPTAGRAPSEGKAGLRTLPILEMPRDVESWTRYAEANAWCHRNHHYAAGALISDDNGATFRLHGYLKGGAENHLMEPQVVELSDGSVVMLLRSMSEGRLLKSVSRDGGLTWSPLERTEIPNPSSKVNVLRHSDGRIFLLHNPVEDTTNQMSLRNPLSLWVSYDDMATWAVKMDVVRRSTDSGAGLNYPSGFLDEEADALRFVWEDAYSVFLMHLPLASLTR